MTSPQGREAHFPKEADAARALIDQGVDIMTQHTDSPAPLQVAESRGILGFV